MADEQIPQGDAVATAREKYHCPACGAEAYWNPAKSALVCPYCGTESPATLQARTEATVIVEHDLVQALRNIPDEARGWKAEKITVRCQSCRALSVLDPQKAGQRCEFCGSAQLVPYTETKDAFSPESLLPLRIAESQARDMIRAWYSRQWLAPNALGKRALTDTVHGLYLPYWTFDANTYAQWTADSGTYYYTGSGKNRQRHVRWTPASGELTHVFDDHLVPASLGVDAARLRQIEPFPTDGLIPYDPGYLAGWTVERYQIDLIGAAQRSRAEMEAALRQMCASEVPGDTYRNLQVQSTFSEQKFKHILVPVWLLTYDYGTKHYQVVINGVTGRMAGGRPWSWIKIALLILLALIVLYVINLSD
jgi:DNA-directed RNA polymerase subunit RPC12/RpoP